MSVAFPTNGPLRRTRPFARLAAVILVAAGAASLGGCGSLNEKMAQGMGSMPAIGLPVNAPERPAQPHAFPAVHDMPPQRTTAVLTAAEQRTLEKELVSAREVQQAAAPKPAAASKPAAKPVAAARNRPAPQPEAASMPSAAPAPSSSRMIY